MKHRRKMVLILVSCLILTLTVVPTLAKAASTTVHIAYSDLFTQYSSAVGLSTTAAISGKNTSGSSKSLKITIQSADPGKGWGLKASKTISPGGVYGIKRYTNAAAASWRAELTPAVPAMGGCIGSATLNAPDPS